MLLAVDDISWVTFGGRPTGVIIDRIVADQSRLDTGHFVHRIDILEELLDALAVMADCR